MNIMKNDTLIGMKGKRFAHKRGFELCGEARQEEAGD